jgi:protein gp37
MTWNPVTGCLHGCSYCFARKIAERFHGPAGFIPAFHVERLNDPKKMKKPQTIFVCSMSDLFGEWVPDLWIEQVFAEIQKAKQHTYIFLTKNPSRYLCIPGTYFSKNTWFGTSVTGIKDADRIYELQTLPSHANKFISFEPLLGDPGRFDPTCIKQVIIGAQTNPDHYVGLEWVMNICEAADRAGAKVFMKDSLAGRWPDRELRRELAWGIHK